MDAVDEELRGQPIPDRSESMVVRDVGASHGSSPLNRPPVYRGGLLCPSQAMCHTVLVILLV